MEFSPSFSFDSVRFTSTEHEERYYSLMNRKIIEERAFDMHPDKHHEIHSILKKHKLTYLNRKIQLMAKELVLDLYGNAYRPLSEDTTVEPELIS